ncbi:hypothetical protein Tco_0445525 [Tanacetum coccineum]
MASESTSSQQSQQLIPSSKVKFRCTDSIIAFNNVVALFEHSNEAYRPMLSFFSNCCINKALTLQPSAMYVEYLKDFWYIAKVEEETKTITLSLSWWDKPMSFTQDEFIYAIGLPICKDVVPLPPKEPGNYISNDLTLVKPHTIIVASFQKPLASEVPLTSHMLKVAKLSEESKQSLIPPSEELKAPTDLKTKKKRILPSFKPKSPYKVRVILLKKQVAETQHAEVTVATANITKSLEASELAEEQVNQPSAIEAEKEEVKDARFVAMEEVTFKQIMDEFYFKTQGAQENAESPYDTKSKIKTIKSYQAATISGSLFIHQSSSYDQDKDAKEGDASESLFGLRSMPNDDLASISGFKTQDSADHVSEEGTKTLHASANKPAQSDPFGHLHAELGILNTNIDQLESNISKKVAEDMKSSVPTIVADILKEQLHGLFSDALKATLPQLIKDSIKSSILASIAEELPQVEAQVQKNLHQSQLIAWS